MIYYSDSNQIQELVKEIVDEKVEPLGSLETLSNMNVYIFDNLFEPLGRLPECTWSFDLLMRRRPDWGGMILELIRKNEGVYLFCGEWWCRVLYRKGFNDFRFIRSRDPVMDAERVCLIAPRNNTYMMHEAIRDLFEPLRFARDISRRVLEADESPRVKSLLTFSKSDYKETCLKLEELICEIMRQRDLWKDRFFFRAIEADKDDLCGECKESMRQAFYVKGDEEEALKWRPGKGECCWRNCKYYAMDTYEEDCDNQYSRDCKNIEHVDYFTDSD